jgi:hypothetical protein
LRPGLSAIVTFWDYDIGLTVVFWGNPSYGTAAIPTSDVPLVDDLINAQPASFANIASERLVEVPTRVARFRAPGDSVDVLLLMQAPSDTIVANAEVKGSARADVWVLPREGGFELRDSTKVRASGLERWIYRVGSSVYQYRIEVTADGSMVAGRASGWFATQSDSASGFGIRGFGTSDIMLATYAQATTPAPARWRDYNIVPVVRSFKASEPLNLLWEIYELSERGGDAQYDLEITVQRRRSGAGRVVAAIVGALAATARVDRRDDRITYHLTRLTKHTLTVVEQLSLDLRGTPSGEYSVSIAVTDRVSGRRSTTTTLVTVEPS